MRTDIDLNFIAHPLTGDLTLKRGSDAIKQSLKNIVLTSFYERGFNVTFGTQLYNSMFDLIDEGLSSTISDQVKQAVRNFEPDVEVFDVEVFVEEESFINVMIYYHEYNDPTEQTVLVKLKRLR